MVIFILSKNRGRVSQPHSDLGCYSWKSHLGTQGSFVFQLCCVTSNNVHLRFSIMINPLHSKPVGLECQHIQSSSNKPQQWDWSTRRGAESEMKQGASPCQSKTRGTARTKHSGTWTKPLEPEPAGQERNLHWDRSYRRQVAKIRARNFGASRAPPDSSLFLTPTDTSAGCSKAPLWVSLPLAQGSLCLGISPFSGECTEGLQGELAVRAEVAQAEWQSWQMVMREISSAPRHWKNHLKKQFITMKLLLLEWKY